MTALIVIFNWHLRVIYCLLKLLPINPKKILLISRQYNNKPIDFILIENDVKKRYPEYTIKTIAKKIEKKPLALLGHYFSFYQQMYHLATSSACVIDTYNVVVSILDHKKSLLVVQLCHGVGNIKKFAYQTLNKESGRSTKLASLMRMHKNYDYVISTSETTSEFLAEAFRVDKSRLINFGPPKIDYLLKIADKRDVVLAKYPELKNKPVVLYVATFRTFESDYLRQFIEAAPFEQFNIIIHLHPVSVELHPELDVLANTAGAMRCPEISTADLLSVADYAITDYSSFIFDAAIARVPTYLFLPDYELYATNNGLNVDLLSELPTCAYTNAEQLFRNLQGNRYDYQAFADFKDKYIENTAGNSTMQLVDLLVRGKSNKTY